MALGLTGRYLGGQATQQEQRFDALGADPDQLQAGSVRPWMIASPLPSAGSRHAGHVWKPSRWSIPCCQQLPYVLKKVCRGTFSTKKLTFSLVLTATMLTELSGHWKGAGEKTYREGRRSSLDPLKLLFQLRFACSCERSKAPFSENNRDLRLTCAHWRKLLPHHCHMRL